mmetsp:Transcript_72569/g.125958  ORF Transcript_72569/g.125958 Transcript_72569/m.125958 type:complete len:203 (-) Transcript_72569:225-833(-)
MEPCVSSSSVEAQQGVPMMEETCFVHSHNEVRIMKAEVIWRQQNWRAALEHCWKHLDVPDMEDHLDVLLDALVKALPSRHLNLQYRTLARAKNWLVDGDFVVLLMESCCLRFSAEVDDGVAPAQARVEVQRQVHKIHVVVLVDQSLDQHFPRTHFGQHLEDHCCDGLCSSQNHLVGYLSHFLAHGVSHFLEGALLGFLGLAV